MSESQSTLVLSAASMPNSDVVATGSSSANAVGVGVMLELPTPVTVYSVPQVVNLVYLTQVYQ